MVTKHPLFDNWYSILNGGGASVRVVWTGDAFRASHPKWMSRPYRLTGVGAVLSGGRWNVRNLIPALNFSTSPETLAAEADARAKRTGMAPILLHPQTRVAFHLNLQLMVNLTDTATLKILKVKKSDLTGCDWDAEQMAGREALTQAVARAAFETRAEGLIVPSARFPGGVNILVFPAHLIAGSLITAHSEVGIPFVHGLET